VSSRVGAEVTTTNGMHGGADPATAERSGSLDRVTAADLMLIWPEKEGWPQVIGALAVLEGRSMVDTDGEFPIEAIRETVGHRLHLVPRFRQTLYWPRRGLGWPVWGDAQSFDIADHVRVHPVPSPGDELQLLLTC
jgi:diacylglycerol O-acyltransferase / wax synthase